MTNLNTDVPQDWFEPCAHPGKLEKFRYTARDYTGTGKRYGKEAEVYLPFGYDPSKKYRVVYLMHGGNDNERWMFQKWGKESLMKNLLDHLFEAALVEDCMICAPTYQNPFSPSVNVSTEFFCEELANDLIPAFETAYPTYYDPSAKVSETREYRAFGGFSMGAATTWWLFAKRPDVTAYYLPMCGDCWCVEVRGGLTKTKETVDLLETSLAKAGYGSHDFYLFAGSAVEDIAYPNLTPLIGEMKTRDLFRFGENGSEGNFSYYVRPVGGHDLTTVCRIVYHGLPRLFAPLS